MLKRSFDLLFSVLALIILFPLMLTIAVLIKLDSRGSVFYRGIRTGLNNRSFRIYKFRTMVSNAELLGGHSTALNDPRLTKAGKFLRRYKLDELPQLINIVNGEMSIVGPRPQVEKYTRLYQGEEKLILTVKPGLTDFASIHFIEMDAVLGDGNVDEKYFRDVEPLKNLLRVRYVKEMSILVDIKIIALTIIRLLRIR